MRLPALRPNPSNPGGPMFLSGLSPLADQPRLKHRGIFLRPYMPEPSKTLPRDHDKDIQVWDLAGINDIS
jgi:hypothetical protein